MEVTSYSILFLLVILYVTASPLPGDNAASEIARLRLTVNLLTQQLQKCKLEDKLDLHLRQFQDKGITCNDGTTAGYYIKRSYESKKWVIFLEGGWYCYDDVSCAQRMNTAGTHGLTSSKNWLSKRRGFGILSPSALENPTWYNANHVLVPYCSSDLWSGNVSRSDSGGKFSFMGYRIINEVIQELLAQGLLEAKHLLLVGSSAGGIGAIMNIDRVTEMMSTAGSSCKVRGIADSGWYLEKKPDLAKCKTDPKNCNKPSQAIRKGMRYWSGVVPGKCANEFQNEPWRCYFGHNVYRTLKSPLFIFQWQYDVTQILVDDATLSLKGGAAASKHMMGKVMTLAPNLKKSIAKSRPSGVFLPACIAHSILTNSDWLSIKVKGYNLNHAIDCWIRKDTIKGTTPSPILPSSHCKSALIDDCALPQCNFRCSAPRNPFTGKLLVTPTLSKGLLSTQSNKGQKPHTQNTGK